MLIISVHVLLLLFPMFSNGVGGF
uniref:Uncharacterized protein n=1 Tax=Rhizophora mucronata TaxID=61149 RepID=A0A2P2QLN6_RHIMU